MAGAGVRTAIRWGAALAVGLAGASSAAGQVLTPTLPPLPPSDPPKAAPVIEAPRDVGSPVATLRTSDSVIFVLSRTDIPGSSGHREVTFREEAASPGYFETFGGGSLRGTAEVDCSARRFQLRAFTVYARNNMAGGVTANFVRGADWQTPPARTLMGRVVALACGAAPAASPATPVPASGRPAPPSTAPRSDPGPPLAGVPAGPQPAPVPPAAAAPRRAAAATAAPQAPVRPAATAPAPRPAARDGRGPYWVQLAAAESQAAAEGLLSKTVMAEPALAGRLPRAVEPAQVNGKAVYRALMGGFQDQAAAVAVCDALKARGHACFVRRR